MAEVVKKRIKPFIKLVALGYVVTPRLILRKTLNGTPYIRFVISVPKGYRRPKTPRPSPKVPVYSCLARGDVALNYYERFQKLDFLHITGTFSKSNFYDPEDRYKHIQGTIVLCEQIRIIDRYVPKPRKRETTVDFLNQNENEEDLNAKDE